MSRRAGVWSLIIFSFVLSGCQSISSSSSLSKKMSEISSNVVSPLKNGFKKSNADSIKVKTLSEVLLTNASSIDVNSGFKSTMKQAVMSDPQIVSAREHFASKQAAVEVLRTQKEFQYSSTVYGGIEDVTDEVAGLALVLSANRMLFDGGKLDAQIAAELHRVEASKYQLLSLYNERALFLADIWVDLEKYYILNSKITGRLEILDPLIQKLEQVAEAGIGDVTQVIAAQRTVSAIKVKQTEVSEKLQRARLDFQNAFGSIPDDVSLDAALIDSEMPSEISDEMVRKSPRLLAGYSEYKAAEATVTSVLAKEKVNVGFEARASRPFGGSDYNSDESVGLVFKRTLFQGKKLEPEIQQAEANAKSRMAQIGVIYREGMRAANSAKQNIISTNEAIELARKDAQIASDEIDYLRRQLVIGGSTLASVLSAEAKLYEAEAAETNFLSEKIKSQLSLLSLLGLLSPSIGLEVTTNN